MKVTSEIGSPEYEQAPQQATRQRNFVIPDGDEEQLNGTVAIQNLESARAAKREIANKLPDSRKEILESLASIGRKRKTVKIDEHEFILQTLKGEEQKFILNYIITTSKNKFEEAYDTRDLTLAHCIYSIDGQKFSTIAGSDDAFKKVELVSNLGEIIIDILFDAYNKLVEETKKAYSAPQEVIDDLKKS